MGRASNSKERMLNAARDLIWKQGYCSVTIDDICQEAGVRKGSFYYFFDSKPDLAAAAFRELWDGFKPQMDEIFSASVPPLERLQNYFAHLLGHQTELRQKYGRVVGCPFSLLGSEVSQSGELVCKNARAVVSCCRKYFETALRDAEAEGAIEVSSISGAAQRLSCYLQGCMLQARIQNDLGPLRELSAGAMELIGVRARPHARAKRRDLAEVAMA
jgi:TetR/AcrR family transcriptional repressor of nem operon